jgi:hypothetical protein
VILVYRIERRHLGAGLPDYFVRRPWRRPWLETCFEVEKLTRKPFGSSDTWSGLLTSTSGVPRTPAREALRCSQKCKRRQLRYLIDGLRRQPAGEDVMASMFTFLFEWPDGVRSEGADTCHELNAETLAAARVVASILYAGASSRQPAPIGFTIVDTSGDVVYRYPEPAGEL